MNQSFKPVQLVLLQIITCFVILSQPFGLQAQTAEVADGLKKLEGYYQFQNKDLYLQIKRAGGRLMLIQQWDYKEVMFDRKSELEFLNPETKFSLLFKEDTLGNINQVLAFGRDLWVRAADYVPEKVAEISPSEILALKAKLNSISRALTTALNSNSAEEIRKFADKYVSEALLQSKKVDFVQQLKQIYRLTGGVDYSKELSFNPKAKSADYQYKSRYLDNVYEFRLNLDQQGKIRLFNNRVTGNPPLSVARGEKELVKSISSTLQTFGQKDIFSGTVLLAKGNKILFEYACGEADKENHQKNDIHTCINLGSMNKMFTSLAIMQLLEKRKLNLMDPVSKFVDTTWMPKHLADKISIHHLLSHTSGMGDMFSKEYEKAPHTGFSKLEEFKPFIRTTKLDFEPGEKWSYSNAGMFLLGVIIEKVSGLNYYDYLVQNIYKPAGMFSTGSYNLNNKPANVAIGYIPQPDGSFKDNRKSPYATGTPAGGGYSTVHDLHKFALALNAGKLVSDTSLHKMFTDHAGRHYGYGFQLWQTGANSIVGHSGGADGISAIQYILPQSGYTIVVLANYDGAGQHVGEFILNRVKANLEQL